MALHFEMEPQDSDVWYLVDSVKPLAAHAKTVVSASYNSKVTKVSERSLPALSGMFLKLAANLRPAVLQELSQPQKFDTLYMPICSWSEIRKLDQSLR